MSTFTPPVFSKFGNNTKTLFDQKYDVSKHQLKNIRRSTNGVTTEVGATFENPIYSSLRGYLKASLAQPKFNFDVNVNTDPKENSTATLKFTRVRPGLILSATHNTAHKWDDKKKGPATVVEATYTKDAVAFHTELKSDLESVHHIKPSLSIGYDNFSLGVSTHLHANAAAGEPKVLDYNLGLEYAQPQYSASLVTENQLDWAVASLFYRHKPNHTVGAQARVQVVGEHAHEITIGNEYKLDATTTIKSKFQLPSQQLSIAVEHRLKDPSVAVNFAAKYKPLAFGGGVKAESFGLGLTFGDN